MVNRSVSMFFITMSDEEGTNFSGYIKTNVNSLQYITLLCVCHQRVTSDFTMKEAVRCRSYIELKIDSKIL